MPWVGLIVKPVLDFKYSDSSLSWGILSVTLKFSLISSLTFKNSLHIDSWWRGLRRAQIFFHNKVSLFVALAPVVSPADRLETAVKVGRTERKDSIEEKKDAAARNNERYGKNYAKPLTRSTKK